MNKKVIAFDLDSTLAVSKLPVSDYTAELLVKLLDKYHVCIISGGAFKQFKLQVVDRLKATGSQLTRLHLMPTCGTRYYKYNESTSVWDLQYSDSLTEKQKSRVFTELEIGAKKLGLWEEDTYGEIIEDRDSEITFSALGQQAPPEIKYKWDPTGKKKLRLRNLVAPRLPDLEVRVGGTTSIDVTMIGVDKAYALKVLMKEMNISKNDILFIGDELQKGGNDYSVKEMGVDTVKVNDWRETDRVIEKILGDVALA